MFSPTSLSSYQRSFLLQLLLTVIGSGASAETAVAKAFPSSKTMTMANIWNTKPWGGRSIMKYEIDVKAIDITMHTGT